MHCKEDYRESSYSARLTYAFLMSVISYGCIWLGVIRGLQSVIVTDFVRSIPVNMSISVLKADSLVLILKLTVVSLRLLRSKSVITPVNVSVR